MYSSIFFLGLLASSVLAQRSERKVSKFIIQMEFAPGQQKGPIYDENETACIAEIGINATKYAKNHPNATSDDHQWNCFVACVIKKDGAITENGTLKLPPGEPVIYQDCYDEMEAENDCETAKNLMCCLQNRHGVYRRFLVDTRKWRIKRVHRSSDNETFVSKSVKTESQTREPSKNMKASKCTAETGVNFLKFYPSTAIDKRQQFISYATCVLINKCGVVKEHATLSLTNELLPFTEVELTDPELARDACYREKGESDCETAIKIINCASKQGYFQLLVDPNNADSARQLSDNVSKSLSPGRDG